MIGTATGVNGMLMYDAPIMWSFTTILVQPPVVVTKSPAGRCDQSSPST